MPLIRINAPEWYQRSDWNAWLNGKNKPAPPATWHPSGSLPKDTSDVFFTYHNGDGSDSPNNTDDSVIPVDIWEEITKLLEAQKISECLVWVSNLKSMLPESLTEKEFMEIVLGAAAKAPTHWLKDYIGLPDERVLKVDGPDQSLRDWLFGKGLRIIDEDSSRKHTIWAIKKTPEE